MGIATSRGYLSPERAYLFGIDSRSPKDQWTIEDSLDELVKLARTAGLEITGKSYQKRPAPHPSTYIGLGKLDEIRGKMFCLDTRILVINDELTPGQLRNIERALPGNFKVIDRTVLILDIFAQHAHSREGQLQVELAQYRYRLPRLTRLWTHLVRQAGGRAGGQAGGVGLRGPGETQIESDRRHMRDRIASLKHDIEEIRLNRRQHRRQRKKYDIPIIAIVGYTNAGKSSLLAALSRADIRIANQLFATLDPATRRVRLPSGRQALFTDTVGFINRLPHDLIAAFRATLEEIVESDLIIHVADISQSKAEAQRTTVENLLKDMGIEKEKILTLWNKVDRVENTCLDTDHSLAISALTGQGIDELLERVEDKLKGSLELVEVLIPYCGGNILDAIHKQGTIEIKSHREDGTFLKAYVPPTLVARLRPYQCDLSAIIVKQAKQVKQIRLESR